MTPPFRRLRVVAGVSMALLVTLAGWDRAVVGRAAGDGPGSGPPLKVFLTDQADLSLPDTLSLPGNGFGAGLNAVNGRGDWVFSAGRGTAVFLRRAGDPAPTRLLQMGRPIPGISASAVDITNEVRINQPGVVAIIVEYHSGVTHTITRAICTYDNSGFHTIATADETAPGSGSLVYGRGLAFGGINDDADVAYTAPVLPPSGVGTALTTVFISRAGATPVPVVRRGDPAPEIAGTLGQISEAQFNNRREVLFRAAVLGGSGGFGYFVARLDDDGTASVRKVVATGDPNLRGGTFDSTLSATVRLNNAGQVALVVGGVALYLCSPDGGLELIVAGGTPMPAPIESRTLTGITGTLQLDDAGAVTAAVNSSGHMARPNAVLRHTATAPLEVLAYGGQSAPGTLGQAFYSFSNLAVNSTGDLSFYSSLAPTTPATGGLFSVRDGATSLIVLNGQAAPPLVGGFYYNTANSDLLDDGSAVFETDLIGSPAGHGAFRAAATGVQVLASNADPLPSESRIVLRELFMDGAGRHTMFWARRAGGGNTFWTHDVGSGITARVVADGDEAPSDGGGQIVVTSAMNRFVGSDGEVVFPATVRNRSGGFLFSWTPTTGLRKLVGPGDPVSGTILRLTSCSPADLLVPPFNGDRVVFRGTLDNGSNGIFLVPKGGGPIAKVVLSTDAAPGGGTFTRGSSTTLNYPYVNAAGQVAFWGMTSDATTGIYIGTAAGLTPVKVAATGDVVPGIGVFSAFVLPGPAGFNDRGEVVFFASLSGGGGGFFLGKADGTLEAIALNGNPAPGGGTYAFDTLSKDARANARGDILFRAPLVDNSTPGSGLFLRRFDTGVVETVLLEGQQVPGTPFVFGPVPSTTNNYPGEGQAVGPTGEVLVHTVAGAGGYNRAGVFLYRGPGTLQKVLMRGDEAPDALAGSVVTVTQGPGTGGEGLFFLRVGAIDAGGVFAEALYALDTLPPMIASHEDVTAEATGPAGAVVTYPSPSWTDNAAGPGLATCLPASGAVFPIGATTVTCTATDGANDAAPVTFTVRVVDTIAPGLSVSVSPAVLWPADNKPHAVAARALATDDGSGVAGTQGRFEVIDEYGRVQPEGTFIVGAEGTVAFEMALEARRRGADLDGRQYVVRVTVRDVSGNETTASTVVVVPHDQGR